MISLKMIVLAVFTAILVPVLFAQPLQMDSSACILEIRGRESGDLFGRPIVCVDLDDDGRDEIVVGADRYNFTDGRRPTLYVFRGRRSFESLNLIDLGAGGAADAVILGETASTNLAPSLASGDVNGDGVMDLVATDSTMNAASDRAGAGVGYVLFGRPDFFDKTVYDFQLGDWDVKFLGGYAGEDLGGSSMFGGMISKGVAAGDLNSDAIADMAFGAHLGGTPGSAGKVYIVFGRASFVHGQIIDLRSQSNVVVLGNEQYAELGTMISIGDVTGDGLADLVLGEEYGSLDTLDSRGRLFMFLGRASFPANLSVSTPDFGVIGARTWDMLGSALALADVNNDGIGDIVVAASGWDNTPTPGSVDFGAIYGFWGSGSLTGTKRMDVVSPDFFVAGKDNSNDIGSTLEAGDVNGDGISDIFFAARDGERTGWNGEGRTFLIQGRAALPQAFTIDEDLVSAAARVDVVINGGIDNLQMGDAMAAGDIDGDGAFEICLAAPFLESNTGRLFVFDLSPPRTAAGASWVLYE